jgi:hypothetical protein
LWIARVAREEAEIGFGCYLDPLNPVFGDFANAIVILVHKQKALTIGRQLKSMERFPRVYLIYGKKIQLAR